MARSKKSLQHRWLVGKSGMRWHLADWSYDYQCMDFTTSVIQKNHNCWCNHSVQSLVQKIVQIDKPCRYCEADRYQSIFANNSARLERSRSVPLARMAIPRLLLG